MQVNLKLSTIKILINTEDKLSEFSDKCLAISICKVHIIILIKVKRSLNARNIFVFNYYYQNFDNSIIFCLFV